MFNIDFLELVFPKVCSVHGAISSNCLDSISILCAIKSLLLNWVAFMLGSFWLKEVLSRGFLPHEVGYLCNSLQIAPVGLWHK